MAVQQLHTTVGAGFSTALYSGADPMGNLRKRFAPSHGTSGERKCVIQEKIWLAPALIYLADWIINRLITLPVHYFHCRFRPADDHLALYSTASNG
ncbi:hypothetical protein KCP69_04320 [Salmonella enterica subsp. enterica]|nr:hypothetical protein KCP69_04320 [Salmonella enterica subsp. enterica]